MLALAIVACDGGERPRIGIATNYGFADAAVLAVSDARAEWGELPADTVLAMESLTRPSIALQSAIDMVERDVVGVVGHSNSAASIAAAPIYNENEVVQLSPQSSAAAYSDAGPYSFRLVPSDVRQGEFIASSLRAMPGVERIVVLYVNDDYGRGLRSTLLRALGADGPRVVGEAPHLESEARRSGDLDLAQRVVTEARPDAIVWLGRPFSLEQYLPVLLPIIGTTPIVASDANALAYRYDGAPLWSTVSYVDFVDLERGPAIVEFGRRFEARYDRPVSTADALTYDAVRLLLQALHDGADTGPEMRAWLESLGRTRPAYAGITGPIRFDEDGDVDRTYVLRRFAAPDSVSP